ncbi:hypothetical protein AB35_4524 [Escherichia coli 2-474-04_S1_C2]|nr:hypothetical protein AB35_4524 [Escherichia coli 2-474-04_S1_C2]
MPSDLMPPQVLLNATALDVYHAHMSALYLRFCLTYTQHMQSAHGTLHKSPGFVE